MATAVGLLCVVATIFLNLYPRVMVSSISPAFSLTIGNSASAPYTLKVMTIVALIFTPIVLVYQGWSYWVFRAGRRRPVRRAPTPSTRRSRSRDGQLGQQHSPRGDNPPERARRSMPRRQRELTRPEGQGGLVDPRLARRAAVTRRYLITAVAVGVGTTICVVAQAVLLGAIVQQAVLDHAALGRGRPAAVGLAGALSRPPGAHGRVSGPPTGHRPSDFDSPAQLLDRAIGPRPGVAGRRAHRRAGRIGDPRIDALDVVLRPLSPDRRVGRRWHRWSSWLRPRDDWRSFVILAVTVSVIPLFMVLLGLEAKRQATEQWGRLVGPVGHLLRPAPGSPPSGRSVAVRAGRRTLERANDGSGRRP